jgi:hypothetical protein
MSGVSIALISMEPAAKPALDARGGDSAGFLRVPVSDTGEFSVRGVIPGTYALWGRWDASSPARTAAPDATALWGEGEIVVKGPDVSGVVLNLQPGARVSGTIRPNAGLGTPALEALRFQLFPQIDSTAIFAGSLLARPDLEGKVIFPSVPPGLYDLRTTTSEGTGSSADTWVIASAIMSGQDVADGPLDIRPGGATNGRRDHDHSDRDRNIRHRPRRRQSARRAIPTLVFQ